MIKIFLFSFFSIVPFQYLPAQDSLGSISELQRLLKDRKDRFDEYATSADQRSGIFGTKTKKDLEQSREILLQIVKTDNNILNELNRAIMKRGIAKADYSYDEVLSKQTVDRLTQATDTLNKQLIAEKELNYSMQRDMATKKWLVYVLGLLSIILTVIIIFRRRK